MFHAFFYYLKDCGLKLSLTEWMDLQRALFLGLEEASLTGFYHLCRAVLLKDEADYDLFDRCFLEYFSAVGSSEEISASLARWLSQRDMSMGRFDAEQAEINEMLSSEEIEAMFQERLKEQNAPHNQGTYWVGTHGMSVFGNTGMAEQGIRVGGDGGGKHAFRIAGEHRYRDFRKDHTLDTRSLQVALRRLRQLSGLSDLPETEFDVDRTIQETADHAGLLSVRFRRPRRNTISLLLLMDCGGSMEYYSTICSALFQAVTKTGHFKDLKIFYFHNCVYSRLYTDPTFRPDCGKETSWVLDNISPEYRAILVGDAQMSPEELFGYRAVRRSRGSGPEEGGPYDPSAGRSGYEWLEALRQHYPHLIWLNPSARPYWDPDWAVTYDAVRTLLPMYPLTVSGIEEGMKHLLRRQHIQG